MSATTELYIANESLFPETLAGDDNQKFDWLVTKVTEEAALWEQLELNTVGYMNSLEALGELAGSKKFFAVLSYNNSPHNLLGDAPGVDGSFGYFTPKMVEDAYGALVAIESHISNNSDRCQQVISDNSPLNLDTLEYTFFKYLSAFQEAAAKKAAVVVIHE